MKADSRAFTVQNPVDEQGIAAKGKKWIKLHNVLLLKISSGVYKSPKGIVPKITGAFESFLLLCSCQRFLGWRTQCADYMISP